MVAKKTILFIGIILVLISACELIEVEVYEPELIIKEKTSLPEIHFCQIEDCNSFLIDLIDKSKESIHCAFFDIDLKDTLQLLGEKSKTLDVKLVIDNENKQDNLKGSSIIYDTSSQYSHNKFCIFDNKIILTGSFNPTENGNNRNDNNIVIIKSKHLVENYNQEFQELWNKTFGKGKKVPNPIIYINNTRIENYFAPEDNCADKIIETINKAQESIYFMTFSFTHEEIADAILFKDIEIKGIFDNTQAGSKYSQYHRFNGFEIPVKRDANKGMMHHKVFIIDKRIVITGSLNPSKNANKNNDENILIIYNKDIAKLYLEEFERIWNLE